MYLSIFRDLTCIFAAAVLVRYVLFCCETRDSWCLSKYLRTAGGSEMNTLQSEENSCSLWFRSSQHKPKIRARYSGDTSLRLRPRLLQKLWMFGHALGLNPSNIFGKLCGMTHAQKSLETTSERHFPNGYIRFSQTSTNTGLKRGTNVLLQPPSCKSFAVLGFCCPPKVHHYAWTWCVEYAHAYTSRKGYVFWDFSSTCQLFAYLCLRLSGVCNSVYFLK